VVAFEQAAQLPLQVRRRVHIVEDLPPGLRYSRGLSITSSNARVAPRFARDMARRATVAVTSQGGKSTEKR